MLPIQIGKQTKSKFITGNSIVGITAKALTTQPFVASYKVVIEAKAGNSDTIYVGESDQVTSNNGWPLAAEEQIEIPIDDPRKVYVIGGAASQAYKWLAI
jgi:hypothetical protein